MEIYEKDVQITIPSFIVNLLLIKQIYVKNSPNTAEYILPCQGGFVKSHLLFIKEVHILNVY